MGRPRTLYDKLWARHVVRQDDDDSVLLYVDRHLLHEVTSPQAFEGMRANGRGLWRREAMLAVPEHNVPTTVDRSRIGDELSRLQVETLDENCAAFEVSEIKMLDARQGIVHVIGPEQGAILPGMTVVCGDSHTSTHGALGCLAFGIGTTEIEHVMATQCLMSRRARTMRVDFRGRLGTGVYAKDMILALIGDMGTAGGTGYVLEYAGEAVEGLDMAGRMTMCNMSIEAGARAGMVAVDGKTLDFVRERPMAPTGAQWGEACEYWRTLHSDEGAAFDAVRTLEVTGLKPQVSWGTSPEMVTGVDGRVPDPRREKDENRRRSMDRAIEYMGLAPDMPITDIRPDKVFIGSCTNSRIEDLRIAAKVVENRTVAPSIKRAMVVPGSGLVRRQAEQEGLDRIFQTAGFEWRQAGCSMCLGMNEDRMGEGERCASTSNRNFEGRQGYKSRTHLVSPAMAAAAAIAGHFVDISE